MWDSFNLLPSLITFFIGASLICSSFLISPFIPTYSPFYSTVLHAYLYYLLGSTPLRLWSTAHWNWFQNLALANGYTILLVLLPRSPISTALSLRFSKLPLTVNKHISIWRIRAYLEHASGMFIFMLRSQGSLCDVNVFLRLRRLSLITDRTVSSQGLRKLPENASWCRDIFGDKERERGKREGVREKERDTHVSSCCVAAIGLWSERI